LNTDIRNGPLIEIELILYIVLSEISQLILHQQLGVHISSYLES